MDKQLSALPPDYKAKIRKKRIIFILQCLLVCVVGLLVGAGGYWVAKVEKPTWNLASWFGKQPDPPLTEQPEVVPPDPNTCPICGQIQTALPEWRPLAITLDNTNQGRPQSGLLEADVVYEAPVEGGLTRLLAIYYHGQPGKVGPIRSTRPYFLEIGQEYEAVPVHCGGSPAALQMISRQKLASIDAAKKLSVFWKSQQRRQPYNLYSSHDRLREEIGKTGNEKTVSITGRPFLSAGSSPVEGVAATSLTINYGKNSLVKYTYDSEKQLYLREIAGKPHQDMESKQQLGATNVIVQFVSSKVLDRQGRLELGLTGSGQALIYTQGKKIEATWSRTVEENRTYFRDAQGNEIPLTPGQTWIELVPANTKVE
jgi:hypothetical protein